jgi:hypothetical protein
MMSMFSGVGAIVMMNISGESLNSSQARGGKSNTKSNKSNENEGSFHL